MDIKNSKKLQKFKSTLVGDGKIDSIAISRPDIIGEVVNHESIRENASTQNDMKA